MKCPLCLIVIAVVEHTGQQPPAMWLKIHETPREKKVSGNVREKSTQLLKIS